MIIQIPEAEDAARKQIYEPGEPLSHVKPVDAEQSQEGEQNPCDGVIEIPFLVPEIRQAVHGRNEKKIDDPTDEEKPERKEPYGP